MSKKDTERSSTRHQRRSSRANSTPPTTRTSGTRPLKASPETKRRLVKRSSSQKPGRSSKRSITSAADLEHDTNFQLLKKEVRRLKKVKEGSAESSNRNKASKRLSSSSIRSKTNSNGRKHHRPRTSRRKDDSSTTSRKRKKPRKKRKTRSFFICRLLFFLTLSSVTYYFFMQSTGNSETESVPVLSDVQEIEQNKRQETRNESQHRDEDESLNREERETRLIKELVDTDAIVAEVVRSEVEVEDETEPATTTHVAKAASTSREEELKLANDQACPFKLDLGLSYSMVSNSKAFDTSSEMDKDNLLTFFGYDLFHENRTQGYYTGVLQCLNCEMHEAPIPSRDFLYGVSSGFDALANGAKLITTAKCLPLDCTSALETQRVFQNQENHAQGSGVDDHETKKRSLELGKMVDNCNRGFAYVCKYGTTKSSQVFNYDAGDDAFQYDIIERSITCLKRGERRREQCPPCRLDYDIQEKDGLLALVYGTFQIVALVMVLGFLLYKVGQRIRSRALGEDEDYSDSEEEEQDDSENEELVETKKPMTSVSENSLPVKSESSKKIGKIDFLAGLKKTLPGSKAKKVVSEKEFRKLEESGKLKGKKVSKIIVTNPTPAPAMEE